MANFCIPKEQSEMLKAAARAGKIDISTMYEMSSTDRRSLFAKYVGDKMAGDINAGFEKAMISERQTALKDWAEDVFTTQEKKTAKFKDVIDKIDELNDMGVLSPESEKSFLSDLVAQRLGATVTSEEAKTISEKATKLQELATKETEYGTPTVEYFEAKRELENYLDSLTSSSRLRIATSTIGRATMLLSVKSPLLNIESNTVKGFLDMAERRITNRSLTGSNGEYAVKYMRFVNEVFQKTGYDISRMQTLSTERRMLGEDVVNTQGKGAVRAIGRAYEDLVFKKLLSGPDVVASSVHFADSANIASTKFARREGLRGDVMRERALAIFKDATRIEPKTIEGQSVRSLAMADAMYGTYTNDSLYSDLALGIRKLFNIPSGDLRVGDQVMPFVKTPANVIGAGIDSSGITLPFDLTMRMINTVKGIHSGKGLREAAGENFTGFARKIVRAGLGMTFAYTLSTIFKPEDFVGEYPISEKERKLFELKQATANSVKIGNKWVSLDYFGPLGVPMAGFLYARKYGDNLPEAVIKYYQGVGKQAAQIPGFDEFYNTVQALKESKPQKEESLTTFLVRAGNNVVDFISARTIPAIVYDYAKATDPSQRKVNYDSVLEKLEARVPELRKNLPEKYNIFGETLKSQGWNTILFGERVRNAGEGKLLDELIRLESDKNLPALTDMAKTKDGRILQHQIGQERFDQAMRTFGTYFKQDLTELIDDSDYLDAESDEERKKMIDDLKWETFEYVLDEYGYEELDPEEAKIVLGE